ncbi:fibronectin type III domain-containing protein [Dactylosporangium sp. NPDC051541]|uniref:fibronectin type III domain-containing protein n=1 Tax=Dactylosporangium sp. NPDC051541 TaxID=3363977 RepID=UPI0037964E7A
MRKLLALLLLLPTAVVVLGPPAAANAAAAGRVMVVGDSISHGSSGDWTWRYRLWKHLTANGAAPDFVGPRNDLNNIMTTAEGDGDQTYADPEFDRDHDAVWGRPIADEKTVIAARTAQYQPDEILLLLGINDLVWLGHSPAQVEADTRELIANARSARPGVRFVLGRLLPTTRAVTDAPFAALVADTNQRIAAVAASLDTAASPVVVAATDAGFVAAEHTWDGVHPNARGELRIAAAFADALAQRFGIGAAYPRPFPDVPVGPSQAPVATLTATGASTADLAWTPSTGATQYWVWTQDTLLNKEWTKLPIPLTAAYNPWHVTQLGAGVTYRYKIQAAKGDDEGAYSNEVTITPTGSVPGTPGAFTVTAGNNQAELRWTAAADATGYLVSVRNVTDGETGFRELPWPISGTSWAATLLENGVRYEFRIQAVNGTLRGGTSPVVGVTLTGATPGAPVLTVSSGNGEAVLSWAAVADADRYGIEQRNVTAGETGFTRLPWPVYGTAFTARGLVNGAVYEYRVQALNGRIAGGFSATGTARPTASPPPAPTGLSATAGNGTVTLRWTEAPGASGYWVHVRNVTAGESGFRKLTWPVDGASWTAELLENGATYEFKLQSVDGLVDGATSATVSATPTVPPPAAPAGLTATAGDGEADLRWTAAANATGYIVSRRNVTAGETGFTELPIAVGGTGWTAEGLSNGATYQFKLQSVSGRIKGATTAAVTVTPTGPVPGAPALTVRAGDRKAQLSWSMPAGTTAVYVWARNVTAGEAGFTKLLWPVIDDAWTATGLVNGATYQYKVQAYNDLIPGGTSAAVTVVPSGPPPAGPESLEVTGGNGKAVLHWSAASRATAYRIWVKDSTDWHPLPVPIADDGWTATGLVNGAAYQFKVQSVDGLTPGGYSNTVSVTPLGPTPQVSNLRVSAAAGSARLQWTRSGTATGYFIQLRDVSRGEVDYTELLYPVTGSSFTVTLLTPGHVYDIRVQAINGQQRGVRSNTVRVTLPKPRPATSASALPLVYGMKLSWKASPDADGYQIYYYPLPCGRDNPSRSSMDKLPFVVTGTSVSIGYLFLQECWYFEVVAVKNGVEADPSSGAQAVNYTVRSNDDTAAYEATVRIMANIMHINQGSAATAEIHRLLDGDIWEQGRGTVMWKNLVCGSCPWDQKPQLRTYPGIGAESGWDAYRYRIPLQPWEMYYDIWSNIHYGYVGRAAGFSEWVLVHAQRLVGVTDAGDDHSVRLGAALWDRYGPNLTENLLALAILNELGGFIAEGKATAWSPRLVPNL